MLPAFRLRSRLSAAAAAMLITGAISLAAFSAARGQEATAGERHGKLLQVPVTKLTPGGVDARPEISNPALDDPGSAIERGMRYYLGFNCVGCHAPNGAGGMGPALSNHFFIYGSEPENIYLSIVQGRPNGMPAWGALLPEEVVWDLVAYIGSLSNAPTTQWGTTISAHSPSIEQVPAEFQHTAHPWQYTQKFSKGQKP